MTEELPLLTDLREQMRPLLEKELGAFWGNTIRIEQVVRVRTVSQNKLPGEIVNALHDFFVQRGLDYGFDHDTVEIIIK